MDINELETYRLADAVKFNKSLNPKLWGSDEHLLLPVRERLLAIADDFREFLGISDLEVKDITISGSNAAYTYTEHSDIDLHLVVDLPRADASEVYRELFDAKKYQYNDQHNYTIGIHEVELYVQNANDEHVSQGIYSLLNNDWTRVPRRSRPDVDDISVRSKYQDLAQRVQQAIQSGDLAHMDSLARKINNMRKTGLATTGEFGPENLAFKVLRNNSTLQQLRTARQQAKSQAMSLSERKKKKARKKTRWGQFGGLWFPGYNNIGQPSADTDTITPADVGGESVKESVDIKSAVRAFAEFCSQQLSLPQTPALRIKRDPAWSERNGTFGQFDPDANTITVSAAGRHPVDIMRTLAHELVHSRQNNTDALPAGAGAAGSKWEDQANAVAGQIMRAFAEKHPEYFDRESVTESSGYIPVNKKEAGDPRYSMAVTVDIQPGEPRRQAAKLGFKTDAAGRPPVAKTNGLVESLTQRLQVIKESRDTEEVPGEDLIEVAMSPGALRQFASSPAAAGMLAGFEAELIFRGLGDFQEPEQDVEVLRARQLFLRQRQQELTDVDPGVDNQNVQNLANELEQVLGVKTRVSSSSHTAARDATTWIFEPDSSLEADEAEDMAIEIVSPPMSLAEAVDILPKFFAWAAKNGAYANKTTGFHMSVSMPGHTGDQLDYTKLALLLGDEYVLKQFDRSANAYATSAVGQIQNRINQSERSLSMGYSHVPTLDPRRNRLDMDVVGQLIEQMRVGISDLATRALAKPSGFGKYVSINPKDNYIEFRSAGGVDYFNDIEKIQNTLMRYARATAAAMDPAAEKQEYAKKLYKFLSKNEMQTVADPQSGEQRTQFKPGSDADPIWLFSRHAAGELPTTALKNFIQQNRQQRSLKKELPRPPVADANTPTADKQGNYEIYNTRAPAQSLFRFSAASPDEALGALNAWRSKLMPAGQDYRQFMARPVTKTNDLVESLTRRLQAIKEGRKPLDEQELEEVAMSPGALRQFASSPAAAGMLAGFEAELVFKDLGFSDDDEMEPDYDMNRMANSIDDIIDFFNEGPYSDLGSRDATRVRDGMSEEFFEWNSDQLADAWNSQALEYLSDYIKDNDEFDQEYAEQQAQDALGSDATDDAIAQNVQEQFDEFVSDVYNEGSDNISYDRAREQFEDEQRDDFGEYNWFRDRDFSMADIQEQYGLQWPYMTGGNSDGYNEANAERLADDLAEKLGVKTVASSGYHQTRRDNERWIFEPDSSLDPDEAEDLAMEIVSPPMPLQTTLEILPRFFAWADENGAYANKTTGFHMSVSMPDHDEQQLDYTKLALLLGDEYVLKQFGRSANSYAASAVDKIRNRITADNATDVLTDMRRELNQLASTALASPSGFGKYTSINPKGKYIEFRSAGGSNYIDDIDRIQNTLMRYARATAAAMDPAAEKQEYAKKLYKLLAGQAGGLNQNQDTVWLFSRYAAGDLPKSALLSFVRQAQQERGSKKAEPTAATSAVRLPPDVDSGNYEIYGQNSGNRILRFQADSDDAALAVLTAWRNERLASPATVDTPEPVKLRAVQPDDQQGSVDTGTLYPFLITYSVGIGTSLGARSTYRINAATANQARIIFVAQARDANMDTQRLVIHSVEQL